MNRHFTDAVYYLRQTVDQIRRGAEHESARLKHHVDRALGREPAPATRVEAVRERARRTVESVRERGPAR